MKKVVGLWIDHREATIVMLTGEEEKVERISSDVEKHVRFSGGAEQATAESILIFGPGEAKGELTKRLESENLTGRIVGVETVDKMTDRQIAARVRAHFQA